VSFELFHTCLLPAACLLWAGVAMHYWVRLKRGVGSGPRNLTLLALHLALAVVNLVVWTGGGIE
jgi:hypothetical protein